MWGFGAELNYSVYDIIEIWEPWGETLILLIFYGVFHPSVPAGASLALHRRSGPLLLKNETVRIYV